MKKGHIFVISGPSGVGKNSVIKEVIDTFPEFEQIPSYTTRAPRHDDHSCHRVSISHQAFDKLVKNNELVDYSQVHGQLYGKKKSDFEKKLNDNKNIIIEIDVKGLSTYLQQFPDIISIFLKYTNNEEMPIRLMKTHPTMSREEMNRRIATAKEEMKYIDNYQYQVTTYNDKPPSYTGKKVVEIIKKILAN